MASVGDLLRLLNFQTYRYFLTDFVPGLALELLLGYLLFPAFPWSTAAYVVQTLGAFTQPTLALPDATDAVGAVVVLLSQLLGGLLLFVIFGSVTITLGLLLNLAGSFVLDPLVVQNGWAWRIARWLDRPKTFEPDQLADDLVELAKSHAEIGMLAAPGLTLRNRVQAVAVVVSDWLGEKDPSALQGLERQRGIAILFRSFGAILIIAALWEHPRPWVALGLGVCALALLVAAAVSYYWMTLSTLIVASRRLHASTPAPRG